MLLPNDRDVSLLEVLFRMTLAIGFVLFVAGQFGCGGPPRKAQEVLSYTAVGLNGVDATVNPLAAQAHTAAMAAALQIDEATAALRAYDEAMHPWVVIERVMVEARGALLSLQSAYDAWKAGAADGPDRWQQAAACAIPILMRLGEVLLRAGVEVPAKIDTALSLIAPFAEDQCLHALATEGGAP